MATYNVWNKHDESVLRKHFAHSDKELIMSLLPSKTWSAVIHRAERLGLKRDKYFKYRGMIEHTNNNNPMKNKMSRIKATASLLEKGINPNSKWARKRFLELFNNKCPRCHKKVDMHTLVVHHKDENRDNNRLTNFEVMCFSCHNTLHNRTRNLGIHRCGVAKITKIEEIGEVDTYDLSTPRYHNFFLSNGILSHNSYKSGVNVEWGRLMDRHFSAEKIAFTNQELLKLVETRKMPGFILRDEATREMGTGSGRQQAFLQMQAETLRQSQISFAYCSPTLKRIGTEHYIMHCLAHNQFKIDDKGMALEPVYVLLGCVNPLTDNYLGGVIVELEWMNKVWRDYTKKKNAFQDMMKSRQFAKADFDELASEVLKNDKAKYCKNNYDWSLLIQEIHPDLTVDENKMLSARIKMSQRIKNGITNGEDYGDDDKDR